ncbi:MAG TPA: hypothetical protein VGQ27_14005 [Steroidobacteraceae bacterium]|nr:hypothetical protein [Steroidobacteraceae bacterium]
MSAARSWLILAGILLPVFVAFYFMGFHAWLGQATIAVSPGAWVAAALVGLLSLPLTVLGYRRESDAVTGTFQLVELHKREPDRWMLRGLLAVIVAGVSSFAFTWWMETELAPFFSGPAIAGTAEVSLEPYYTYRSGCRRKIGLRLADGRTVHVCIKMGSTVVPPNASCVHLGEIVDVGIRDTPLGQVLTITRAPPCGTS